MDMLISSILAACLAVTGGDHDLSRIEPQVEREAFDVLLQTVPLDADQSLLAEVLFQDYLGELDMLAQRLDQRYEEAGAKTVEAALAGRMFVAPGRLRTLRIGVHEVGRASWSEAENLATRFIESMSAVVGPRDPGLLKGATRGLRRSMLLSPLHRDRFEETYAGDGIDLVLLASDAVAPGGELASIDMEEVAALLAVWDHSMDRLLARDAARDFNARVDLAIARIRQDRDGIRRAEAVIIAGWLPRFELTRDGIERVRHHAAAHMGEEEAGRWAMRCEEASFPWLVSRGTPEREYAWMDRHLLDPDQKLDAGLIMGEYRSARRYLERVAIEIVLNARRTHGIMLHARLAMVTLGRDEAALFREYLKNSGSINALDGETSTRLAAMLTHNQRLQMQADLAAAAFGRRQ